MGTIRNCQPIESLAEAARGGRLIIFCGAGVSMLAPSRSPSWWEIYASASAALANRLREGFPEISFQFDIDELLRPLQTQQLADLIVSQFAGDTFVEILKVVDVADPNENHVLIVALAAIGSLRGIVTTNFDTLIERTAVLGGAAIAVAAPRIVAHPRRRNSIPLIKLHGSAVDALQLIETTSAKSREIDPALPASWAPIIGDSDLLVLGYSGADLNFGAARAFFEDFLRSGREIWWLFRPGSEPTIPEHFLARVNLVEGHLPDLLRDLATAIGAVTFNTPVAGRDAQLALRNALDAWSKNLHIGRWSAAVFFQSLVGLADRHYRNSPLGVGLTELARLTAEKYAPGAEFSMTDMGAAMFLGSAGRQALSEGKVSRARTALRASVNIFENVHKILGSDGDSGRSSEPERQMNLASSWGNYAQVLVISGEVKEALAAFLKSLGYAYLSGNANSFLIALTNVLHYGFEYNDVRHSMRLLEAGVRLADRIGAVQSSTELRLHLAGYHIDRNEVWAAASELHEAKRRATAVHDHETLQLISILEAHVLLKKGKMLEGLTAIADLASPHSVFFHRAVKEVQNYIQMLGAPQKVPFVIDLSHADVQRILTDAAAEITAAKNGNKLPWQGRHCLVSESACLDHEYAKTLFTLGLFEFDRDSERAVTIALSFVEMLLDRGYYHDALWAAKNVLANPDCLAQRRAWACSLITHAYAELGHLHAANRSIEDAKHLFNDATVALPLHTADVGLWHSIQSGDVSGAVAWAGKVVEIMRGSPEFAHFCSETIAKVDSWGSPMAAAAQAFRQSTAVSGLTLPSPSKTPGAGRPFRRFLGTTADLHSRSDKKEYESLDQAQTALSQGDYDKALALIDSLSSGAPDHLAGIAIALQIQALDSKTQAAPADLDKAMDQQRQALVRQLAFSALARLETSLTWMAVGRGDGVLAAQMLSKRAFVGELADDPQARVSLLFWETQISLLTGENPILSKRGEFARLAVRYYGTAEMPLLGSAGNALSEWELVEDRKVASADGERTPLTEAAASRSSDANAIVQNAIQAVLKILRSSSDPSEVDAAFTETLFALHQFGGLTPLELSQLRGERANWALRMQRYKEALKLYREVQQEFRSENDIEGALNSMAGEGRSLSRSGDHDAAVRVFEQAIQEAATLPIRPNLLIGLASCHLLEATEHGSPVAGALIDMAIDGYKAAIAITTLSQGDRALARLGLARALGEQGDQTAALCQLDQATAELAHLGSSMAKVLIEARKAFEDGDWKSIGLQ